jgi:hypothetical protein
LRLALSAIVAAVALAACGGSSHRHAAASTVTIIDASGTASSSPASTTTTSSQTRTSGTATKRKAHTGTLPIRTAQTTAAPPPPPRPSNNGTAVDPANTHPTAAGPKPLACLSIDGLDRARVGKEPGVWMANYGTTSEQNLNAVVFVDGPFKSKQAADASVASLSGVEIAMRGGLYEVSASLPSRLTSQVRAVANCLQGAGASQSKSNSYSF